MYTSQELLNYQLPGEARPPPGLLQLKENNHTVTLLILNQNSRILKDNKIIHILLIDKMFNLKRAGRRGSWVVGPKINFGAPR